ncbi:L-lactate dehydrogenase [Treponema denticola]|nr:L-lactate dehydrogenase [Treponema denticola]EMB24349.1 L-lactate dehydrogenase [Treponema denticola SP37]EPF35181.1 L-lactate dehydrogenase [Treponema denticola SP44]EPF38675.1 L-lactate dehydrogenase [Treponema denticola SP23]UTC93793.1 L-lactate dehydrogenase [Treponema denticola]
MDGKKRKVTVVGAGAVGSTFAYALAQSGYADEIAITDMNKNFAEGQALDLVQGLPFLPQVDIHAGDKADYADSDIVVVTAGAKQQSGETRIDLLKRNASIITGIAKDIAESGCSGVMLIVSNPVDILTRAALKASGWERGRVIGSGTVLDTARFRYTLSKECGVDARNIHGYILGEHGDSEFAAWSMTSVAGRRIDEYCSGGTCSSGPHFDKAKILEEVRNSAYHIIDYKGSTYFAVGLALTRIAGAILRNEHSILSVSMTLDGEFGLKDVCLSVPCIVGRSGAERVIESDLPADEQAALEASAKRLKEAFTEMS